MVAKGVTSMSVLAHTLTTAGVTPDEALLRGLLNFASPGDVPVQTLASIRRLVFESQTLATSRIKSIVEADAEKKIELAPAERASRIGVTDKQLREKCTVQDELHLAKAWTRRSLTCDLIQVATFSSMERWHRLLLNRLPLGPPPQFQPTSLEYFAVCQSCLDANV